RRARAGSGASVLGLVRHRAEAERSWFGHHLAGAAWDPGREHGMTVPASRAAADVLRDYRAAVQDSDRAIRAAGHPDARFAVPVDGNRHTLRWVMAHMTSETARHAGTRTSSGSSSTALPVAEPGASRPGRQPLDQGRHLPPGSPSAPHVATAPPRSRPPRIITAADPLP